MSKKAVPLQRILEKRTKSYENILEKRTKLQFLTVNKRTNERSCAGDVLYAPIYMTMFLHHRKQEGPFIYHPELP